jgi:Histidine kinase
LISEDGRRSLNACRPAEGDGFQIPSPDRACTRLEYQDSVRAAPPWSDATDADSHLEPAPAGSSRTEFAAVSARIIAAADEARRRIARDLHDGLQQQLVCLGLRVRLAEASIPPGHEELKCELDRIAEGLKEALETSARSPAGFIPPSFPNAVSGPGPPLARPGQAARGDKRPAARSCRDRRLLHPQ